MIRDTSREAYFHDVLPTLGHRQAQVFSELVQLGEATNMELSKALFMDINRITPRVFELRDMGVVIDAGTRLCRITGRRAHVWRPRNGDRQLRFI